MPQLDLDFLIGKTSVRRQVRAQGRRVVIFRCGMGRDSVAMLCLLADRGWLPAGDERIRVKDVDAVVFTDTGGEWPYTLPWIPKVRALCRTAGLRFIVQEKPPKEGPRGWAAWLKHVTRERNLLREDDPEAKLTGLVPPWQEAEGLSVEEKARSGWYHVRAPIMDDYVSRSFLPLRLRGDCTMNHKVAPNRKLIEDLAGVSNRVWSNLVQEGRAQRHLVLLGIAADEPHRVFRSERPFYEQNEYPLVQLGISKPDEEKILSRHGFSGLRKSACFMCKWQTPAWYWVLSRRYPDLWRRVVAWDKDIVRVRGEQMAHYEGWTMDGKIRNWREQNPTATEDEILRKEYRRPDSPATGMRVKGAAAWCRECG